VKDLVYHSFIRRLNAFIDNIDELKEEILAANKFETKDVEEDFLDNVESVVVSIEDIVELLEADKAYKDLKKNLWF